MYTYACFFLVSQYLHKTAGRLVLQKITAPAGFRLISPQDWFTGSHAHTVVSSYLSSRSFVPRCLHIARHIIPAAHNMSSPPSPSSSLSHILLDRPGPQHTRKRPWTFSLSERPQAAKWIRDCGFDEDNTNLTSGVVTRDAKKKNGKSNDVAGSNPKRKRKRT